MEELRKSQNKKDLSSYWKELRKGYNEYYISSYCKEKMERLEEKISFEQMRLQNYIMETNRIDKIRFEKIQLIQDEYERMYEHCVYKK
jgi:murein L,D-transpeptidase YafK